jgi:hypothetical protein
MLEGGCDQRLLWDESSTRRVLSRLLLPLLATVWLAFLPGRVSAQSEAGITGVVTDPSGASLAGVTIEVASPQLIEGTRTTTTDGSGQFRVVNLRPGTYSVTFTYAGFNTLRREGITLTASFTATVNGSLQLGQSRQQVTVTTEAPLVDVQNSQTEQVMDRHRLDVIPSGRDPFAVGQLIAGVTTSTPDVGGTGGMQQPTLQVHGSSGNDNVFMVDSIWVQHVAFSGNQTGFYFNDNLMQEIAYSTSTLPAEAPIGGIQINMIPREGGNEFHGSIFGTGAVQGMQSDNLTSKLIAQGLTAQNKIDTVYDINAGFGGPIIKDRLWFYASFRRWGANNFLANTFTPQGTQALDDNRLTDLALRFTYQLNKSNKVSVSYDRSFKFRGHRPNNLISASISNPIASVVQHSWMNYMGQAKWTSTPSSKLVIQAGYTQMPVHYDLLFEPGIAPGTVAAYDNVLSTITRASPREDFDRGFMKTYMGNVAYISGSHDLKTGIQARTGYFQESFVMNNDMVQILANGVPNSIRLYNTSLTHREDLNPDLGWFLQDTWKITRRLTLNPGIRFEHMVMSLPAQGASGGLWTPARSFAAQNGLVSWNTWSPRFGFAWDVFGDSKTAVRGGVSKYDRLEGTTLLQNINPNFISFSTCPWTSNVLPTSPAQLVGVACTGFSGNNNHIDPNIKRPYQMEYDVMVQRQFGAHMSASVGYYHRDFHDLYGILNTAVPSSAYSTVSITNPITGQPLTVYNQSVSTLGKINNVQQTLPQLYQRYNGVEFQVNAQLAKATVFGGFTIGKDYGTPDGSSTSMDFNNPNNLINYAGNIGYDSPYQIRAGGSYRFRWGIQVSGSLRENSGLPQGRNYNVTQAIVPGLTQVTQSVTVVPPGTYRYPWQNLLDLRFSKIIRIGERVQLEPTADLFNVFNCSAVTSAVTTVGPSLLRPSNIDFGRMVRLGGQIRF